MSKGVTILVIIDTPKRNIKEISLTDKIYKVITKDNKYILDHIKKHKCFIRMWFKERSQNEMEL